MLLHGDCIELMASLPAQSVDMVLCDLPYGSTSCAWDEVIPFKALWSAYERVTKPNAAIVLTASQPFTSRLIGSKLDWYKYNWVWMKNVPTGMASSKYMPMKYHEDICVFVRKGKPTYHKQMVEREGVGKDCYRYEHYLGNSNHVKMDKVKAFYDPDYVNPSSVLLFNTVPNRIGKLHPTQKPVDLFEYLIRTYTNVGDTVLDNCIGSGTTAIAAANCGRNWIGMEKDEAFYKAACTRIGAFKGITL
jgi:site-specific DNA-methyltransferase (adenine-specific)